MWKHNAVELFFHVEVEVSVGQNCVETRRVIGKKTEEVIVSVGQNCVETSYILRMSEIPRSCFRRTELCGNRLKPTFWASRMMVSVGQNCVETLGLQLKPINLSFRFP